MLYWWRNRLSGWELAREELVLTMGDYWQSLPVEVLVKKATLIITDKAWEAVQNIIAAREQHPPVGVPMSDFTPQHFDIYGAYERRACEEFLRVYNGLASRYNAILEQEIARRAGAERERARRSLHIPSPTPCAEKRSLPTPAT